MKKKWIYPVLILVCILVFFAYRTIDRKNTDAVPPVITIEQERLECSVLDEDALLQGMTVTDETDGDVTASLVVESVTLLNPDGTVSVVYAAFDSSGNVAKTTREVKYTDYESPRFSLSQALIFTENSGFDVLSMISAQDALDGSIGHWIRATSLDENSIGTVGEHQVQFRVTNSLGDTTQLVLPVEVNPVGTYHGTVGLSDYLIYCKVGDSLDARDFLVSYTLGGQTFSFDNALPESLSVEITDETDLTQPGVYQITYHVSYIENGNIYTGCSRLMVVVEG